MGKVKEYIFKKKVSKKLKRIEKEIKIMSQELDELTVQVSETVGVEQSVLVLLQGIQARLNELIAGEQDLAATKAKLVELSADLDASEDAVAAAVANFPVPPPAP